jgi:hypothetical protein
MALSFTAAIARLRAAAFPLLLLPAVVTSTLQSHAAERNQKALFAGRRGCEHRGGHGVYWGCTGGALPRGRVLLAQAPAAGQSRRAAPAKLHVS